MALTKEQKKEIVENLKEKVEKQKTMVFVDIAGLKVSELFDLRKDLRAVDSLIQITKKTLFKVALKDYSQALFQKIDELKGQIAVIFGFEDEILPAKAAYQFSGKSKNLKILGGYFEKEFQDSDKMIEIAKLPTHEELLAQLVRSVSAPISNFLNVLQGNLQRLTYLLSVIKK